MRFDDPSWGPKEDHLKHIGLSSRIYRSQQHENYRKVERNGELLIDTDLVKVRLVVDDYGNGIERITYPRWIGHSLMTNRDCLEPYSPHHTYNMLRSSGVIPEYWDIQSPYLAIFDNVSRADLINELIELRSLVGSAMANGIL